MPIEIPGDLQSFVDQQVKLGSFESEQQVVAAALQLLKADREEAVQGIRAGLSDAAAGRLQPVGEAFADLRCEFKLRDPE
jgi:Arc/MetJ-type ribon-helix-helix transcriptional regulator